MKSLRMSLFLRICFWAYIMMSLYVLLDISNFVLSSIVLVLALHLLNHVLQLLDFGLRYEVRTSINSFCLLTSIAIQSSCSVPALLCKESFLCFILLMRCMHSSLYFQKVSNFLMSSRELLSSRSLILCELIIIQMANQNPTYRYSINMPQGVGFMSVMMTQNLIKFKSLKTFPEIFPRTGCPQLTGNFEGGIPSQFQLNFFNDLNARARLANNIFQGMIEIILGPMFSGKSSELLRKVKRFQIARRCCLVINYTFDNRYSSEEVMSTHDKLTFKAVKCTKIAEVSHLYGKYDVIAIDEAQFFPDLVEMCEMFAEAGKTVIVAGLDGTFQRKPFGRILELIPIAEKVTKLSAICIYCNKDAAFTQRIVDSQQIQLIGGQETYKPTCRTCFNTNPSVKTPKKAVSEETELTKSSSNSEKSPINPEAAN